MVHFYPSRPFGAFWLLLFDSSRRSNINIGVLGGVTVTQTAPRRKGSATEARKVGRREGILDIADLLENSEPQNPKTDSQLPGYEDEYVEKLIVAETVQQSAIGTAASQL